MLLRTKTRANRTLAGTVTALAVGLALATTVAGCAIDEGSLAARGKNGGGATAGDPVTAPPADVPGGTGGLDPVTGQPTPIPGAAFEASGDGILLLPFNVRMNKLAAVVGVPTTDAMFAKLKESRLELGDYDFAQGISPDLKWTSKRVSAWVRALVPVCESPAMKAKYPAFDAGIDAFVRAAYGRASNAEDTAALSEITSAGGLSPEAAYRTTCLALLSSAEFVAQ